MTGVSVVIPHHGPAEQTQRLIDQLRSQSGSIDIQIIIADDAYPQPFPRGEGYEVVRREVNGGFGTAVNSGAARALHSWLMILNSDLEVGPDLVARWLEAAESLHPAVTAPAMMEPRWKVIVGRRFQRPHHLWIEAAEPLARFHGQPWLHRAMGLDMETAAATGAVTTDWLVGAALLLPIEEFWAVDGFDERYYMNAEEMDLQHRLKKSRGVPAIYLPMVEVRHEGGGSSPSERRAQWVLDGRFLYAGLWGGALTQRLGLQAVNVVNLLWQVLRRARGADVQPLARWRATRERIARAKQFHHERRHRREG